MARRTRTDAGAAPPLLRFPCGHAEPERAVLQRARSSGELAWVACRRCNVIALVIARPAAGRMRPRRRRGGDPGGA